MALHWQFSEQAGTVTMKNGEQELSFNWYEGNALMIVLNEWEEKGERYWSMNWFFADEAHAKNCLGLSKGHENIFSDCNNGITKLTIYRNHCRQWKKLVDLFTKAFPDIIITIRNQEA